MVRSRIAAAVIAIATVLPGVAFAAPTAPAPTSSTSCGACSTCNGCSTCNACDATHRTVDQGPFAQRDSIVSVEPYRVTDTNLKRTWTTLEGAIVKVRPAPGVTASCCRRP
jgi:hypothetical protein